MWKHIIYTGITDGQEVYYADGKYGELNCDGTPRTPSPTPEPEDPDPTCSLGIINGDICCLSSCGSCGGSGCSNRDGGSAGCCTSTIRNNNESCDENAVPCVIQPQDSNDPDPNCDNGIEKAGVCCHSECGTCGGSGCSRRYLGASYCCTSTIKQNGNSCSENSAPCVMD